MTNTEQIAVNWITNNLPTKHDLHLERLSLFYRNNLLIRRFNKCHCDDPNDQIKKIPIVYTIYPSTGEANKGIYNSIPLSYTSWLMPSNALPYIEVIETPVISKDLIFYGEEKEAIEKKLQHQGIVIIGEYKKITNPISQVDLKKIRIRALSKILEISNTNAHIFLSVFPNMPKMLVEDGNSSYQLDHEKTPFMDSWEFQSKRLMPIMFHKKLFVVTLSCWILTRKDLNIV